MDREFWLARWAEGKIGFHSAETNRSLLAFADRVKSPGERVFVPLAGKSNDMAWLTARGDAVVGVELSRTAVEAFFEEHGLSPVVTPAGNLERFEAAGVVLYVGDFFDLTPRHIEGVSWVFDRAAFFALPPPMRERYAAHMTSLLALGAQILLLTLDYDASKADGPPFSIPDGEVERLFGGAFSIESLRREAVDVGNARLRESGVTEMHETTWLLRKGFSV